MRPGRRRSTCSPRLRTGGAFAGAAARRRHDHLRGVPRRRGPARPVAIIVGEPDLSAVVPVRVHSSCLTGDLFGSLKCDCGDQLRRGLRKLKELGGGVLLYLDQEGRGTGIAAKMRAYGYQHDGRTPSTPMRSSASAPTSAATAVRWPCCTALAFRAWRCSATTRPRHSACAMPHRGTGLHSGHRRDHRRERALPAHQGRSRRTSAGRGCADPAAQ